ncbi:MAG: transposase family protein, partial [Bacteroidetes bacterium]
MTRRLVGVLRARLPELGLEQVKDPRRKHGRRWSLPSLLTSVLVGVVCGRKSLAETESLTGSLTRAMRRLLKVPRRVPDTTARDALVQVEPDELREVVRRQCRAAWRRKALKPQGLPCGVVSIDGKGTATPFTEGRFVQKQGESYGVVRTLGSALISSEATVCLDAEPIP